MHIALLSGGEGWHVRDLLRAATELGHRVTVLDFRTLIAEVGTDRHLLRTVDAVIVRTMPHGSLEQVVFRMDILHALAARGIPILNPARALETCIDKYLTTVRLEAAGLLVPPTIVCQTSDAALEAFEKLGGDVVVKPIFGSEGRGMMRISDPELAWRTFQTLERTQAVLYLQQFIQHPGWDIRAFVIRGRIIAGMRRIAHGDWRTNVAQGARAEVYHLSTEEAELALRAASAVGTVAAGVDLLPGPNGERYVIEVNAVPGWRTIAPTTGVDVAREMIRSVVGSGQ